MKSIFSFLTGLFTFRKLFDYLFGVFLAILDGVLVYSGTIIQKKVINEVPADAKFLLSLVKNPWWLLGFCLQAVGTVLFLLAQGFIGPTLIPGLMASGMIILTIGSVKILKENLKPSEYLGIFLMMGAITFIGFSNMGIDINQINFLDNDLIVRISIFTISLFLLSLICLILQKRNIRRGISLAVFSGLMYGLSNFWISPLIAFIFQIFAGNFQTTELLIFITASIILVLTNLFGITEMQKSLRLAQASNVVPIQQVPIQIAPPFYFLAVYLLPVNKVYSVFFLLIGIGLVIASSFLLGKRQAEIEKIQ